MKKRKKLNVFRGVLPGGWNGTYVLNSRYAVVEMEENGTIYVNGHQFYIGRGRAHNYGHTTTDGGSTEGEIV